MKPQEMQCVSCVMCFCPLSVMRNARVASSGLPAGRQAQRSDALPVVVMTWAWCIRRSTVAVVRVGGMNASEPAGWVLGVTAMDFFIVCRVGDAV